MSEFVPPVPPTSLPEIVIGMENITKRFPGVIANQGVHLHVEAGAFHAVIGENGAGKSTLLNILYGRYRPDAGRIFLHGEEVTNALRSPADAIRRGLGLVSQHYALIPALSLLENVILGAEPMTGLAVLNRRAAADRIEALARQLGLGALDLNARADRLTVAAQQKVEILKALYRGARILLLDEPTATLAPQEAEALFALLHTLVAGGATVVFVTHKLREVVTHSTRVSVLRAGRNAGDFVTAQTSEAELLASMIGTRGGGASGRPLVPLSGEDGDNFGGNLNAASLDLSSASATFTAVKAFTGNGSPLLQIEGVTVLNARARPAVQNVSLDVKAGEIVGVAGVDGSGQRELAEAVAGLRRLETGRLFLAGRELTRASVRERQRQGVAYIPEDRHRAGMVLDFTVAENYLLGHERVREWGGGRTLNPNRMVARTAKMIQRYDVRGGSPDGLLPARTLSGGNQQKVVIARAMASEPRLLIACQPTRGLDVEAARFVYDTLRQARAAGLGVLLFSLDLDEIFALADRIAVMFDGGVAGVLPRAQATSQNVGALMTGATKSEDAARSDGAAALSHREGRLP